MSFVVLLVITALLAVFVRSEDTNLRDFGPVKAALEYDRDMLESEVAVKPHFIMFHAPWYVASLSLLNIVPKITALRFMLTR